MMPHCPYVIMLVLSSLKIIIHWPHETGTRKQYEFIGTKILNLTPKQLLILSLLKFKIDFRKWLLYKFKTDLLL